LLILIRKRGLFGHFCLLHCEKQNSQACTVRRNCLRWKPTRKDAIFLRMVIFLRRSDRFFCADDIFVFMHILRDYRFNQVAGMGLASGCSRSAGSSPFF